MKAIVQDRYGPAEEVLQVREIDVPVIGADEVLVRVRAASVHVDVWHAVNGRPWVLRLMGGGFLRPKHPVPGSDMSGVIEEVGREVSRFRRGDEVFGETFKEIQWRNGGAFAELVAIPQEVLALKPAAVTFEEAAAVPAAGFIALNNLRAMESIEPGHRILVNGAGGSVGTLALQIAAARGALVTAVDRTDKLEMLRTLGAAQVVDYTREDVTQRDERFDLILDVASNLTLRECKPLLSPEGVYVFIGHDHFGAAKGRILGSLPRGLGLMAMTPFVKHLPRTTTSTPSKRQVITALAELLEKGKITPVIDRIFPLDEACEAIRYLESGRACGKILIAP